jgi:hypothetical protein
MRWKTIHSNAIESDAGYVILRCTSYGKPTGRYITMLGRTTRDSMPVVLDGHDSAEAAKEACEVHYAATRASAA